MSMARPRMFWAWPMWRCRSSVRRMCWCRCGPVRRAAATSALGNLVLGLGAVALLIGGVGVANVMVISVLERRSEIGLRRALGAARGHIRLQFLTESMLLATIGGALGLAAGAA